jgi:diphosphate-dependent phosphofructokinase
VQCALASQGGVVGEDEEPGSELRAIEFDRIKGGKPLNIHTDWFVQLLKDIGQPKGAAVEVKH